MAKKIDFAYLRKNCATCKKAVAWLESIEHSIAASEDAAKIRKTEKEAVALARKAKQVIAAKGKSIARLKTSADSSDEDLTSVLMGPTGNLRAPTLLVGSTLLVGFNEEAYEEVFGK